MATKERALKIFEKYYEQWEEVPRRMESGYDHEATHAAMMQKVEREFLQVSVGKVPKGINSKKAPHPIWRDRVGQVAYPIALPYLNEHWQLCSRDDVLYGSTSGLQGSRGGGQLSYRGRHQQQADRAHLSSLRSGAWGRSNSTA